MKVKLSVDLVLKFMMMWILRLILKTYLNRSIYNILYIKCHYTIKRADCPSVTVCLDIVLSRLTQHDYSVGGGNGVFRYNGNLQRCALRNKKSISSNRDWHWVRDPEWIELKALKYDYSCIKSLHFKLKMSRMLYFPVSLSAIHPRPIDN